MSPGDPCRAEVSSQQACTAASWFVSCTDNICDNPAWVTRHTFPTCCLVSPTATLPLSAILQEAAPRCTCLQCIGINSCCASVCANRVVGPRLLLLLGGVARSGRRGDAQKDGAAYPGPRAARDVGRRRLPQHAPAVGLAPRRRYQEVNAGAER